MKNKNVNNDLRGINKNFAKEKELEDNLKYEIAKDMERSVDKNPKNKQ